MFTYFPYGEGILQMQSRVEKTPNAISCDLRTEGSAQTDNFGD